MSSAKMLSSNTYEVFRQTRHANEFNQVQMSCGGKDVKVVNWSRTGVGFEAGSDLGWKAGETVADAVIHCDGIELYRGDVTIRSVVPKDGGGAVFGASFASALFLTEGVESATAVHRCVAGIRAGVEAVSTLRPDFCQAVLALKRVLREIRKACDGEEQRWKRLPFDRRCEAERVFLPGMVERVKAMFFKFNADLAAMVDVEALPEDSIYHQVFKEEIYPFFEGADLVRRAYEKPRGYAGDYEMMNQIYRNGYEGADIFGRVLHNYIANENSGESVKFRKPYFVGYYDRLRERKGALRALSIACGPSVEYQEIVAKWPQSDLERLDATLFDLDREALEHAQTKIYECAIRQGKRPQVTFVNASVKSFLTSNSETGGTFDLIYSGGLFDYLDNVTSAALVRKFSAMLNPGGTLIIGNFTKENSTKAFLHLLTDWALIHKTEAEMRNWATGVEGVTTRIEYDTAGINAFLVVSRNETL